MFQLPDPDKALKCPVLSKWLHGPMWPKPANSLFESVQFLRYFYNVSNCCFEPSKVICFFQWQNSTSRERFSSKLNFTIQVPYNRQLFEEGAHTPSFFYSSLPLSACARHLATIGAINDLSCLESRFFRSLI